DQSASLLSVTTIEVPETGSRPIDVPLDATARLLPSGSVPIVTSVQFEPVHRQVLDCGKARAWGLPAGHDVLSLPTFWRATRGGSTATTWPDCGSLTKAAKGAGRGVAGCWRIQSMPSNVQVSLEHAW